MRRILIVEDERQIVKHLRALLEEEGFSVDTAAIRAEAESALEGDRFDLILLDLMLPDGNGYALCTEILHRGNTPVIFLTALDDEASIVTGFNLGADDYITKPFKPMELVARVKNSLRRSGRAQSVFQLGNLSVDTAGASVRRDGQEIVLSALEYRLLLTLLSHRGEVLSRSRLLQEIWDASGDFVNDNTLTVYIKRLREKIEKDPAEPRIIKTVRGLGYKVED